MNSDRIKEIQMTTAYPNSVSVKQALLQVWNECEQGKVKNLSSKTVLADEDCDHPKYERVIDQDGHEYCGRCHTTFN